jgi:hypothetical protein
MISNDMKNSVSDYAAAVTPSDSAVNDYDYLWVGGAGDLAIVPRLSGSAVTLVGVQAGSFIWIRTSKIMSTNTTATSIVGFK